MQTELVWSTYRNVDRVIAFHRRRLVDEINEFGSNISELIYDLQFPTIGDIADAVLAHRDELELWASMQLVASVEGVFRQDLEDRVLGLRHANTKLTAVLLARNQKAQANGREVNLSGFATDWHTCGGISVAQYDELTECRNLRNWVAHGRIGPPPVIMSAAVAATRLADIEQRVRTSVI